MIYKYTHTRYKAVRKIFERTAKHKPCNVVFAYGPYNFKFKHKGKEIQVSQYDEEIIIRKLK